MRAAASLCRLKPDTLYVLVAERGVLNADFSRLVEWISAGIAADGATEEKR
jgi:hypothetical protein